MTKILIILFITFGSLYAKSSMGACIPINQIIILKKSIMQLNLSKEQEAKFVRYKQELQDELTRVKSKKFKEEDTLSGLFDDEYFHTKHFMEITAKESMIISKYIAKYFQNIHKELTQEQRVQLVKRLKRIEKSRERKLKR